MTKLYIIDPSLVDRKLSYYLSSEEQSKASGFHSDKDRELYELSHIALRQLLSQQTNQAPESLQFFYNQYGKPFLLNDSSIHFNLSHTQQAIACTIGKETLLGVDIEYLKPIPDLQELCEYAFHPNEAETVLSLPKEKQLKSFYTYWTLKEAYIKALGTGLSTSLQSFYFQWNVSHWELKTGCKLEDKNWHVLSMPFQSTHIVSLVVKSVAKPTLDVVTNM